MLTYADMIEHLVEFASGHEIPVTQTVLRQAIEEAYEEIASAHDWPFLQRQGRIHLRAAQRTGTVSYTHATRTITLSGATFPAWAKDASIRFGGLLSDIEERIDDTTATLNAAMNPGKDVAETTYQLFPRWYHLPEGFLRFTGPYAEDSYRWGSPISLTEMLECYRYHDDIGEILYHAIAETPDVYGRMALYVWPPSAADATLDYIYTRRPRGLRFSGHDAGDWAGTVSVAYGSSGAVGAGTAFDEEQAGSILRIGRDANRPTGYTGEHPFALERAIKVVADAAHLAMDGASPKTLSGVGYMVTDPVDLGKAAHNAFRRLCELRLVAKRNHKLVERCQELADRALLEAMGASNTMPASIEPRLVGPHERVEFES